MSYIISESQRLASADSIIKSKHLEFDVRGMEITSNSVGFGQPLYTFLSEIVSYKCVSDEGGVIPLLPRCGVTLTFIDRGDEHYEVYICGPIRELRKIEVKKDNSVLLMNFIPGMANSLLRCPIEDLTETSAKATVLLHGGQQIYSSFAKPIELEAKIKQISAVLRTHILRTPHNNLITQCVRLIYETDGNIRAEALAEEMNVTARYIGKLFETYVGLSPKYCSGIIKLNEAIRRVMYSKDEYLTNVAAECGYFDHTHMNKYFRKMVHCSSGEIRKNNFDGIDYSKVDSFV